MSIWPRVLGTSRYRARSANSSAWPTILARDWKLLTDSCLHRRDLDWGSKLILKEWGRLTNIPQPQLAGFHSNLEILCECGDGRIDRIPCRTRDPFPF